MTAIEDRPAVRSQTATLADVDPRLPGDFTVMRVGLWSVTAYVVLGLTGFAVFAGWWPPLAENSTTDEVATYFRERDRLILIGMVLQAMCGPFYFTFSIVLARIIERMEGPMGVLAQTNLIGGMLTGLVTFTPAVIWGTAAFRADERAPDTIAMLYDFGWLFFDLTFWCSGIQAIAIGIAILRDRREQPLFPRWVAWLSFLTAVSYCDLALMPFLPDGPFAWNGLLSFWAVFVLFFVLTVVLAFFGFGALRRIEAEIMEAGRA